MKTLNKESTIKFLNQRPTMLATFLNQLGQRVEIYEHPERGDEAPVYAKIENTLANTGFYDCEDFITTINRVVEPTEYMPVLLNNRIKCAYDFDID